MRFESDLYSLRLASGSLPTLTAASNRPLSMRYDIINIGCCRSFDLFGETQLCKPSYREDSEHILGYGKTPVAWLAENATTPPSQIVDAHYAAVQKKYSSWITKGM